MREAPSSDMIFLDAPLGAELASVLKNNKAEAHVVTMDRFKKDHRLGSSSLSKVTQNTSPASASILEAVSMSTDGAAAEVGWPPPDSIGCLSASFETEGSIIH